MSDNSAPQAKQIPHPMTAHGETRNDEYYWMRNREDPDTVAYLEAENQFLETHGPSKELQETLYQEMFARIKQSDQEVPVKHGPFWYYSRTVEGKQYRVHCRKRATTRADLETASEEVLLDLNAMAEGLEYFRLSLTRISPDHGVLAYSLDTDGSSNNTIYFKNLRTGEILPDQITKTESYASLVWAADNQTVFYARMDDAHRPCELWRHTLGTPSSEDQMLFREDDETFSMFLGQSNDDQYLFVNSNAKITGETRYLRADDPHGSWQVFRPRERGIEYNLEHSRDRFLVLTNENATNFKLMSAPVTNSSEHNARYEGWQALIAHKSDSLLEWMMPFQDHLVLYGREAGLTKLWLQDFNTNQIRGLEFGDTNANVWPESNHEFESSVLNVGYTSMVTPRTVLEINLETNAQTVLKQNEVEGGYDPSRFESKRIWVNARDGERIPVSLVAKRGVLEAGSAPTLLYAYGSYGIPMDPGFGSNRLSLLERDMVYAIAHIRGGNEMGRTWYEAGKLKHKMNTFTDFIDCAEHLIQSGITSSNQLAVNGVSAGGLLMGAITNMRPDLFQAVIANVPFVDVMTTMLDASIPLTTLEYDEWGNPNLEPDYTYMRAYSPYDNLEAKAYPHLLVTTGLNDPRVAYWEPAKWVAKLRTVKTNHNDLFLHTNMGAGHGGASGRFDQLREIALEYAFILEKMGVQK
jgi:oligopeptidase B